MKRVILLSAGVLTLALSYLLDLGFSALKRAMENEIGFDPAKLPPRLLGDAVSNLVILMALIGLAWLVLSRSEPDRLVSSLYIVLGLLGLLYLPLVVFGSPGVQDFLTSSSFGVMTRGFRMTLMEKFFGTYFGLGSAGFLVIGVLGLFRRVEPSE